MSMRRKHPPEFKAKVVMEILSGEMTTMEASRKYRVKDSLLYRWKSEFWERLPQIYGEKQGPGRQTQRREDCRTRAQSGAVDDG